MFISKIVQDRLRHKRIDANNAMIALTRKVMTSSDKYEHVSTVADYLNALSIDNPRVKAKQLIDELLVIYGDKAVESILNDTLAVVATLERKIERLLREKAPRFKRLVKPTDMRLRDTLRVMKVNDHHATHVDGVFQFYKRLGDGNWLFMSNGASEMLVYAKELGAWYSYPLTERYEFDTEKRETYKYNAKAGWTVYNA